MISKVQLDSKSLHWITPNYATLKKKIKWKLEKMLENYT